MFCAAVPVTAAIGARLNANQLHEAEENRKPISKITGAVITALVITSVVYHSLRWQN